MRQYYILLLIASVFLLGCSKNESEYPGKYFIGNWSGYIANVSDEQDVYNLIITLDSARPEVECEIIPAYRYIIVAFEGENLEKGDMLIILHNSSSFFPLASLILHPQTDDATTVSVDIVDKGQYQGVLYRISN